MKKLLLSTVLLLCLSLTFTSCRDTKTEDAADAMENAADAMEDAADDMEATADDAMDATEMHWMKLDKLSTTLLTQQVKLLITLPMLQEKLLTMLLLQQKKPLTMLQMQ